MTRDDVSDQSEEGAELPKRSSVSDELDVPDEQPDPATTPHIFPDEKLHDPKFEFQEGPVMRRSNVERYNNSHAYY